MRKITLILSLLVAMVTTAVAAVGDAVNLENGTYVIKCYGNGEYAKYDGGARIIPIQPIDFEFCPEMNFTFTKGEGDNEAYYTIQTSDNKFVTYKGTGKNDQIEINEGDAVTDDNKWWNVLVGNGDAVTIAPKASNDVGWNFSVSYNNDANGAMGFWDKGTGNGNSHWYLTRNDVSSVRGYAKIKCQGIVASYNSGKASLVKADDANSYFLLRKNPENNSYSIQTSDGKYVTYSSTNHGSNVTISNESDATDSNKWWVFYPNVGACGSITEHNVIDIYPKQASIDNTTPSWNWAKTIDSAANSGIGLWEANNENSYCQVELVDDHVACIYDFTYNGETLASQGNYNQTVGSEYPALVSLPYGVTATKPAGNIESTNAEYGILTVDVPVTIGDLPFKASTLTEGKFGEDMHWYYMTLKGGDLTSYANATNVGNVTDKTLRNLYAFVGNPFAGYKIYNAQAGSGKVLWSSWVNDHGNPIPMTDVASVTEGTDWLLNTNSDGYGFKRNGTDNAYVNNRNSTFSYWTSNSGAGDTGSRITFGDEVTDITALVESYRSEANAMLEQLGSIGFDITAAKAAIDGHAANDAAAIDIIIEQLNNVIGNKSYALRNGDTDTGSVRYNKYLSAKPNSFNEVHGRHLSKDALWKFVLDGTVFYLYNEKNNVYLGTPNSNGDFLTAPTVYYTFSTDKNASVATGIELHTGNQTLHMNNHNSSGNRNNLFLSSYDENDAASCWHIEEPVLSEEQLNALEELETVYDAKLTFKSCESGTSIGQYSSGDVAAVKKTFVDAETIFNNPTAERTADEFTAAGTAITDAIGTLVISMPTSGKYYRIKGACDATPANYYISGNTNGDGGRIACKANADATTVFYYNDNKLLVYNGRDNNNNIIDGLYFGLSSSNWKFSTVDGATPASTIEFVGSTRKAATYTVKSEDVYVYYKVYGDQVEIDRYAENSHQNLDWTLEEVTSLPVTITAAEYATFHAPVEVTIPEDVAVTAHTVTINATTGNATLSEAIKVIPANTPVILNGAAGTYNLDITTTGAAAIEGNALSGTVAAEYATDDTTKDVFVLAKVDTTEDEVDNPEVGLYLADRTTAFALKGHAAYLVLDKANPANNSVGFRFDFNTTAIEEVETENGVEAIYDLQGRRINEITQPGIYVVGGVKRVVK